MEKAGSKIKRSCENCGKNFEVYKSSLEKSNSSGKFCCRKCYNEYQKTLTKEKNNNCTGKFVKCANCGKAVWLIPSREKTYINKFCSNKCRHEYHHNYIEGEKNVNWKGGTSRYRGGDFEKIKKKYFKNATCALCGTKKRIHIHHIIPYRLTQDNDLGNLVPLCAKHHKVVENLFVKQMEIFNDYETTKAVMRNILDTFAQTHKTRRKNGTT